MTISRDINQHPGPLHLDVRLNEADGWLELSESNEGEVVFLSILPTTARELGEALLRRAEEAGV